MPTPLVRRELQTLETWYNSENRKPLIIRGARQVGKSTLVQQFARHKGLSLLSVNFERNPEYRKAFSVKDPVQILATLEILTSKTVNAKTSLVFFDEIQVAPEAIVALRYFYEEKPDIPVLAAGSLLEFSLAKADFSMPVGRIEYLHMGPMTFSDFLIALGETSLASYLSNLTWEEIEKAALPAVIHEKGMALFQQYCLVGGMPEAVACFAEDRSYSKVLKAQHNVLATYRDDFNKYSHGTVTRRIQLLFDQVPALVGKRFKYVQVSKEHRAAELRNALDQLCMARVLTRVYHSAANGVPLGAEQKQTVFKLLFMDVGLLCAVLGMGVLDFNRDEINLINKGAVAEQFIGQHLLYSDQYYQTPSLFYWVREAKNAAAEVDYLLAVGQTIIPIEIKAGATGTLRSLHRFCYEKQNHFSLRFNAQPPSVLKNAWAKTHQYSIKYHLLSLPLYMVGETKRLSNQFINSQLI